MSWENVALQLAIALIPVAGTLLAALVAVGLRYLREKWAWIRESRTVAAIEEALLALIAEADALIVARLKAVGEWSADEGADVKRQVLQALLTQLTEQQLAILGGVTEDVDAWLSARLELLLSQYRSETAGRVRELANPPSPLAVEVLEQLG